MQRQSVVSSTVASIGYYEIDQILEVEFKNKVAPIVYHYFGVPIEVYQKLIDSSSVGKFIHEKIKDKYEYRRI